MNIEQLLAAGAASGVVQADGLVDVEALRGQAHGAGARVADLGEPGDKDELLAALSFELELPEWFGMNWDALDEVLGAPEPPLQSALLLIWPRPKPLIAQDPESARTFERIVADAASLRRDRGYGPLVLLKGGSTHETEQTFSLPLQAPRRVHHVAVVVRDLEAALGFYRDKLGLELELVLPIETDRVNIAFLGIGESKIELVEPTDDSTGVARFLASRGEGFHHVCLEVADVDAELARLAAAGVELIDTEARRGAEGPVAFIHPRSCHGVLVELIEAVGGPAWERLGY